MCSYKWFANLFLAYWMYEWFLNKMGNLNMTAINNFKIDQRKFLQSSGNPYQSSQRYFSLLISRREKPTECTKKYKNEFGHLSYFESNISIYP
jgi:hypothetical protein